MKSRLESIRQVGLGFLGAAVFTALFHGMPALAQTAKEFIVRLQDQTPGQQQSGNSNISGTAIAGQFQGGGSGLTGVNADLLDGLNSTAFLQSIPVPLTLSGTSSGSHIIRGENAAAVNNSYGVRGEAIGASGNTYGVSGRSDSTSGTGVSGFAASNTGTTIGVWGSSSSPDGRGVYGYAMASSGTTTGVWGRTGSPNGRAVYGRAEGSSGLTYGGRFESDSTGGIGVFGLATAASGGTYGGYFQNQSTSGVGAFGYATATAGTTSGLFGQSDSANGRGVYGLASAASGTNYGVVGQSDSTSGFGVFGLASATSGTGYGGRFQSNGTSGLGVYGTATATTGTTYGVWGHSSSTSGTGVHGTTSATSGTTYGGYFESGSTSGIGVYGGATATSGGAFGGYFECDSTSGYGLYARANATSGTIYGVRGYASTAAAGYAVYAAGDMGASGTKPFRIDHPFDPENKYLLHYSSESPFPQNFYNGNVATDGKGYAWVQLPDYFAEINANFKYQLTVVDDGDVADFVQVKVSRKIHGNRFQIRTSVPRVEVSWMVFADRNDKRIQFNRPTDVREKGDSERGKYQHPEYYGLGPEMGMDYDPRWTHGSVPSRVAHKAINHKVTSLTRRGQETTRR